MQGSFTVGGTSPSFPTLQAAANALKARGLGGPVTFNLRPGTYMESNGAARVLLLDGPVAGMGPANRITIQSDAAAGGDVNNVILQADQPSQNSLVLVDVMLDYVTFRRITFADADSGEFGARELLSVTRQVGANQTVEGLIVEECVFNGNPANTDAGNRGTRHGVLADGNVTDCVIRGSTFRRFRDAVSAGGTSSATVSVVVEDNLLLACHSGRLGFGIGITAQGRNVIVRRNVIDNAGSRGSENGIVVLADTGRIERNYIRNGGGDNPATVENFDFIGIDARGPSSGNARSMLVANNMISNSMSSGGARTGILTRTRGARIVHNTVVHPQRQQVSRGIVVDGDSCTLVNNIVLDFGIRTVGLVEPITAVQQQAFAGLVSDYNVIYCADTSGFVVTRGTTRFSSLSAYRAATGLDSHSVSKSIDFLHRDQNVHLTDCQSQDPALHGIPFPGVTDDYDGEARSASAPMIGADENRVRSLDMFTGPFIIPMPGTPMGIAAGRFDNLLADGLAVTDYDNRTVRFYHNNSSSRSFTLSGTRSTGFRPTVARFYDLDRDGNLDLVVGGETTAVRVFWGDGVGGFPQETLVPTRGRVVSIDTGRVSFLGLRTVVMAEDNGFLPTTSWLTYLDNSAGRSLVHLTVRTPRAGGGNRIDTVDAVMHDLSVGDLDGNGSHEVAALALDGAGQPLVVFADTAVGNHPWGHRDKVRVNTSSYVGHASNIAIGRFDGDADNDLVATGSTSAQIMLLRNQGNRTFIPEAVPVNSAVALAAMDYERDGDLDVVTANRQLDDNGVTVLLNDGTGHFEARFNCYMPSVSGVPFGVVASDFDLDGRTDVAIASSFDMVLVLYNLGGGVSGVDDGGAAEVPAALALEQNFPNPFNPSTRIRFSLPSAGMVSLRLCDLLGREVRTVVREHRDAGRHEITFDASGLASGVYFYRLEAGGGALTRKLLLLK
jgi:hypothetical protein